ncbi:hypothetical protein G6F37_009845 [Rhizopus arrhizus]|nr:hypothetical protein G6F38_014077 [Rhizopus arrhizus]KAG1154006.1 hypothetical protein G6F37_009843 [Rhizopus arrhizus]KAG1154008.1 hypothetical protein G6F37_009845 [Rhizopus arrhizus]
MYAQSSGLFSSLLLLTTLISGLSAAVCFPLSGVSTGDLPLTAFLLVINSWVTRAVSQFAILERGRLDLD